MVLVVDHVDLPLRGQLAAEVSAALDAGAGGRAVPHSCQGCFGFRALVPKPCQGWRRAPALNPQTVNPKRNPKP